ncbi:MAG: FtsX-like permease family protein, partial [Clostridiales bacterium]|nr:FtsX-like permease family protein [Clostridiales bacterium]
FKDAMEENTQSPTADIKGFFLRSSESIVMNDDATAEPHIGDYYNWFAKYEGKTLPVYGADGERISKVGDGEIAVVYNILARHYYEVYYKNIADMVDSVDPDLISAINAMRYDDMPFEEAHAALTAMAQVFEEMGVDTKTYLSSNVTAKKEVEIVGYFYATSGIDCCYLGDDLFDEYYVEYEDGSSSSKPTTKYEVPEGACIDYVYVPYDGSTERIEELIKLSETREKDDSAVVIQNAAYGQIQMVVDIADTMEMYFIIIGAVLAVFAFLLMFNFISASITAKKKEIGILRAIGARTTDVFKIFISEALIIAIICFVLAALGTLGLCILLNSVLANDVGLGVSIFVFGPLPILCVFGVAFITAIISTVIPVAMYSRKPPIASIRAL